MYGSWIIGRAVDTVAGALHRAGLCNPHHRHPSAACPDQHQFTDGRSGRPRGFPCC